MKTTFFGVLTLALTCASGVAGAADDATNTAYHPDISSSYHQFRVGFQADVGLPSGLALGISIHPKIDWLVLTPSLTYNGLAFGARGSIKLDPMALLPRLPIGLFADFQAGFAGQGDIPGHSNLPSLGYDYVSTYLGLRLGRPNDLHLNIEAGPSWLHFSTSNFQQVVSAGEPNLVVDNPVVNGRIFPTFVLGLEKVW